jgi:AcrR family transcriptional regulator
MSSARLAVVTRLTRAESQARTRAQLLTTARELFLRDGYLATSLDKVADAAGFSKGAVYSNFRNKDELCLAVLDEIRAARAAEITGLLTAPTIEDRLRRFEQWAERVIGDPQWTALEFEFAVQARRDPALRQELANRLTAVGEVVRSAVAGLTSSTGTYGADENDTDASGGAAANDIPHREAGADATSEQAASSRIATDRGASDRGAGELPTEPASEEAASAAAANDMPRRDAGADATSEPAARNQGASERPAREQANERAASERAASERAASERAASEGAAGLRGVGQGLPMAVDDAAVALLCLGVGLGLFRSIDPEMPVSALVNTVRVLAGVPARG